MSSRIAIIEDNEKLALGLRNNLEYEGHAVRIASDGAAGLALAHEWHPDLVVLDLMLPGTDGYRVLRDLRTGGDHVPVLILSALGEEVDKIRGFRAGADDYVTKPFGLLELLARIEALLRRAAHPGSAPRGASTSRIAFGNVVVDPGTRSVLLDGHPVDLRPKEFELLVALAHRRGQLVSRTQLLKEVWGYGDDVSSRTIDTHMAELRRKLEKNPAAPAHLLTVRKAGYRLQF